jgi:hypothetical protein
MSIIAGITSMLVSGIMGTQPATKAQIDPNEVSRKLRLDYLYSHKDQNQKSLDTAHALFDNLMKQSMNLDVFMNEVVNTVRRKFWIREVTIALLDRSDMKFHYRYQSGLRNENWAEHLKLSYSSDQYRSETYKAREISKQTLVYLAEDNPYAEGEEGTVNRPIMMESKRISIDESIEGDYFDTSIPGKNGEVVGYIEFSGTTSGKMPDAMTLKWIELIASVAGVALLMARPDDAGKLKK